MKIAISSNGKDIEGDVNELFGRCPYFIIAEIKNKKVIGFEAIENISKDKAGGAGISAAQNVVEKEVNAIISGNIGPRAMDVFRQFKIETYKGKGKIKEVLQKFEEGKLEKLE